MNESEGHVHFDKTVIGPILDVSVNPKEDYIRIDFQTTYGQNASILTKYGQFRKWFHQNKEKFANVFKAFLTHYIDISKEEKETVDEIVDGDGNLYDDQDMPSNSTGSMVGRSVWDLEKVYSRTIRGSRRFTGDLGIGIITW